MKTSEILLKAAEGLRTKGFAKFERRTFEGKMCALGAIDYAIPSYENRYASDEHPAVQALAQHVPPPRKENIWGSPLSVSIADWNNAPERTAEEVIATFLAAAACEAHKEATS